MKADHVVLDPATQAFHCKRCGDRYVPTLPAPVTMYVGMMKVFVQQHRHCKPAPETKP